MGKTVRVTFKDKVMLFGDSYKPWHMQVDEYIWMCRNQGTTLELLNVECSHSKWVTWGGLKWCPEDRFQHQLNREGCQDNEPDNPKPRIYEKMNFKYVPAAKQKVIKLMQGAGFEVDEY